MRGVSFLSNLSVEAFNGAVEAAQRNSAYLAAEIQVGVKAKREKINSHPEILAIDELLENNQNIRPFRLEPHRDPFLYDHIELGAGRWMGQTRPFGETKHIKSVYRHEELTRDAVEAAFQGVKDIIDAVNAEGACRASPHFTKVQCNDMKMEAMIRSLEVFIELPKDAEPKKFYYLDELLDDRGNVLRPDLFE